MRFHHLRALMIASIGMLLSSCGITEQPTSMVDQVRPLTASSPEVLLTPTPASPASQTSVAMVGTLEARRIRLEQTARARGPAPTRIPTTPDVRPTHVPSHLEKLPGGGYLNPHLSYPSKHPRYINAWLLDLPDKRQLAVYAGGYIYPLDNYGGREILKPEQGAFSVKVFLYQPPTRINAEMDQSDPRNRNVILPLRDGMARVVDALVTDNQIMVMLRTDGGSAYTYEVNSDTLAPAQPPTTDTGGPYSMLAGHLLDLEAHGYDAAGTLFDYAWDLDSDGVFESSGQRVTFSAKGLAGAQEYTVRVRVTARSGLSATAETRISIQTP